MGDNEQTSSVPTSAEENTAEEAKRAEEAKASLKSEIKSELRTELLDETKNQPNISGEKVSVRINLTETDKKMNVKIDKDQLINFINEIIIADNKN